MYLFMELLIVGSLAGVLSGWLGIGGGIIVVPTLAYLFQHAPYHLVPQHLAMQVAIASSLVSILFTSLASARSHQRRGSLRWDIVLKWLLGLCAGAVLGAICATTMQAVILHYLFVCFLLLIVIKWFAEKWLPKFSVSSRWIVLCAVGLIVGFASGLLGVGGGVLMMPVLIGLGCSMPESAATSSASTIPLALVGGISFMLTGYFQGIAVPFATGYVYWPAVVVMGVMGVLFAPVGVKLSHKIPAVWTKRALAVLLLSIAMHMLV